MRQDLAIDFLLLSVIGASSDDSCGELIKASIERAYQDASSHVGYEPKQGRETDEGKIIKAIENLEAENQASFDMWHDETCRAILPKEGNGGYGKAQKWLNMTLKYLAVTYAVIKSIGKDTQEYLVFYEKTLQPCESYFHIPIDSYICDALAWSGVADDSDNLLPLAEGEQWPKRKKVSGCATPYDSYVKSWSTWSPNEYKSLSNSLKSYAGCNLDWETQAWITVARCRRDLDAMREAAKQEGKRAGRKALKPIREDYKNRLNSFANGDSASD